MKLRVVAFVAASLAQSFAAEPIVIGDRLELFVDHHLIERMENVRLTLGTPRAEEIALTFDPVLEGPSAGAFSTVFKDGDLFRLYYRGRQNGNARTGGHTNAAFYAESRDGIHWHRPQLGLFEFQGSKANNLIFPHGLSLTHNFCPFLDTRPGVPADERYKAIGGSGKSSGVARFVSADGIHWRDFMKEQRLFIGNALDSLNVVLWSPAEQLYVVYLRNTGVPPAGGPRFADAKDTYVRSIWRATSRDFVTWTQAEPMDFGGTPLEHLYTNATHPYFRAPHILIALPMRHLPRRKVLSDDELNAFGVDGTQRSGVGDAVLMTSRGGNLYDRTFMESFIRPGLDRKQWSARNNYPACGVVQTGPTEMSLYVSGHYTLPDSHLRRYSLRLDGFASARAPYEGGALTTKTVVFSGRRLVLNYSTSAAGSLRVELLDDAGRPLPGHAAVDSDEIVGDEIARVVTWKGDPDLGALAGHPVRLRFRMKDADLYSYRFEP